MNRILYVAEELQYQHGHYYFQVSENTIVPDLQTCSAVTLNKKTFSSFWWHRILRLSDEIGGNRTTNNIFFTLMWFMIPCNPLSKDLRLYRLEEKTSWALEDAQTGPTNTSNMPGKYRVRSPAHLHCPVTKLGLH